MSIHDAQTRAYAAFEWGFLIVLCGFFVWFGAPAHTTTLWADSEFTGWVAPLANRLAEGNALYDTGMHIPLPPLSFVFLRLVTLGDASWLAESTANALFQAFALFILFAGLRRSLGFPTAFLTLATGTPLFYALPKSMLYDSMAQCFAAATLVLALGPWTRKRCAWVSVATALCVMTKQSTGVGIGAGVLLLLLCTTEGSPRERGRRALQYIGWTAAAVLALALVLFPFLSLPGLLVDVFLTGSQPKGGLPGFFSHLVTYAGQGLPYMLGWTALVFYVYPLAARTWRFPDGNSISADTLRSVVYTTVLASVGMAIGVTFATPVAQAPGLFAAGEEAVFASTSILYFGLVLGLGAVLLLLVPAIPGPRGPAVLFIGKLTLVALPAAICHNLSVEKIRWQYDNNPLVIVALAAWFAVLCAWWNESARPRRTVLATLLILLTLGTAWFTCFERIARIIEATQSHPEIRHLRGARMSPKGDRLTEMVALVKQMAPAATDTVLLLPEDPNVAAWFDRPRPKLQGGIIFTDQYWDRYVDEDLARLSAALPKIIIIGPQKKWRTFQRKWNVNVGAERLIDLVTNKVLPGNYLQTQYDISYQDEIHTMIVYRRRD